MIKYEKVQEELLQSPKTWLITGVAGFIGSNLLETLLNLNQKVIGLDNFATGHQHNLDEVKRIVSGAQWSNFKFHKGDIRNIDDCKKVIVGVDFVLHQAALGSVPRSIADPIASNESNVSGFLNMLEVSKDAEVKSFTYAASSSTYGDHPDLPKVEENIGNPLSPYAVTKLVNELYASVYARTYSFSSVGLRYFNVFGKRQDPNGAYAAVIPKWVGAMLTNKSVIVNGDGETSRDFCYIDNVVQANILAATNAEENASSVYNVAIGDQTTLNELFGYISGLIKLKCNNIIKKPIYKGFRAGDVRHSRASINKIGLELGYEPKYCVKSGLKESIDWYYENFEKNI